MIVATTEIAVMTGIAATIVAEMSVAVGKAAAEIAAMTGATGKPSLDCRKSPFFFVCVGALIESHRTVDQDDSALAASSWMNCNAGACEAVETQIIDLLGTTKVKNLLKKIRGQLKRMFDRQVSCVGCGSKRAGSERDRATRRPERRAKRSLPGASGKELPALEAFGRSAMCMLQESEILMTTMMTTKTRRKL